MVESVVKSAGDAQQVRRGRKIERERDDRRRGAWRAVLATRAGRAVLYEMLVDAGRKDSTFSTDVLRMAAMAGQRENGLRWELLIREVNSQAIAQMEAEADADQQLEATQAATGRAVPDSEGDE